MKEVLGDLKITLSEGDFLHRIATVSLLELFVSDEGKKVYEPLQQIGKSASRSRPPLQRGTASSQTQESSIRNRSSKCKVIKISIL